LREYIVVPFVASKKLCVNSETGIRPAKHGKSFKREQIQARVGDILQPNLQLPLIYW
jgi:hypothetical protein